MALFEIKCNCVTCSHNSDGYCEKTSNLNVEIIELNASGQCIEFTTKENEANGE